MSNFYLNIPAVSATRALKSKPEPGEKLELGAGERPTPGFIHQDIRALEDIEIICDLRDLSFWVEPGWSEVKAAHVLEHFPRFQSINIMKTVKHLLVEGGRFYIEVPNFSWQTKAHANGEIDDAMAVYYVFGAQDYEENTHKNGYTEASLRADLTEAGFEQVEVIDIGQVLIAQGFKFGKND